MSVPLSQQPSVAHILSILDDMEGLIAVVNSIKAPFAYKWAKSRRKKLKT